MKKNNYLDELQELTKDKIKLFEIFSLTNNFLLYIVFFFTIWYIYEWFWEIKLFFNYFYDIWNIFDKINMYKELFLGLLLYLLVLWYVKWKKGLIFEWLLNQGNFIYPIIIIRDLLLVIMLFYLLYIFWENKIEFIFLLFMYFLSWFSSIILNLYIWIKSDYEIAKDIIENKISKLFKFNFMLLKLSSWFALFYSFFVIYLWVKSWFNFITIIFSHIVFVTSYIVLSILNNWIASYVCIKYNWNTINKGLIYDRSEENYFVKEWKDIYVIPKSSVESIKISK